MEHEKSPLEKKKKITKQTQKKKKTVKRKSGKYKNGLNSLFNREKCMCNKYFQIERDF